jgi:hypothetical protein
MQINPFTFTICKKANASLQYYRFPRLLAYAKFKQKTKKNWENPTPRYTDKKENQIFLIYREIQSGAVAKSYMTNGLLIYGEIFSHFLI